MTNYGDYPTTGLPGPINASSYAGEVPPSYAAVPPSYAEPPYNMNSAYYLPTPDANVSWTDANDPTGGYGQTLDFNTDPSKYRTRVCRHFNRGYCALGEGCSFIHTKAMSGILDDSTIGLFRTKPCRHFQRGYCSRGSNCSFSHTPSSSQYTASYSAAPNLPMPTLTVQNGALYPLADPNQSFSASQPPNVGAPFDGNFKTQTCRHFLRGYCALGDSCNFSHVHSYKVGAAAEPFRTKPCRHFLRGHCALGERCGFAHTNVGADAAMTKPCRHFARGFCQLGDSCNFAHGGAEVVAERPTVGEENNIFCTVCSTTVMIGNWPIHVAGKKHLKNAGEDVPATKKKANEEENESDSADATNKENSKRKLKVESTDRNNKRRKLAA